ncbi:protein BFR2-like isoform X1 [Quercus lobata]|uniref:protein BFR2-like isoform X1 n=1 Tax=Quercus lobata TaxID=97700 RepID=UPI001247C188|nr:protein BFR2-like isoform X1 [Quercus lobata]
MGLHSKRSKKAQDIDSDFEDFDEDMENGNLTLGHEEEEEANYEDEDGEGDEGEANNGDEQMEQLEEEYKNLKHQEIDIFNDLKRHKDEDLLKGQAVKYQKALWDKALELRLLVQKAFSSANRLPQVFFGNSERSSKHSEASKNSNVEGDEDWSRVSQLHLRIASFRDKSIDKWQRKTEVATGAAAIKGKLHAFNQNISEQVADYMRDPSRMLKQMQLRRSTVSVFGTDPDRENSAKGEEVQADGDPELLDDSEFYTQLLKEFLETNDPKSSDFYALKRLQTKKRKIVDRRASKSRKIRYNVHEKIVNFMAPQTMDLPPMAPKLFENLFGLKTQKPASVV